MSEANRLAPDPLLPAGAAAPLRRVLIIGDGGWPGAALATYLLGSGFQITLESDPVAALQLCKETRIDFLLVDFAMTAMPVVSFCREFRSLGRDYYGYLILLTQQWKASAAAKALSAGADDCIMLPLDRDALLARLAAGERVLRMEDRLISSNRRLQGALAELRRVYNAMETDLREARKLQLGLVPEHQIELGEIELSLLLRPAGHIGGDLVGYRLLGSDRLAFYAIDVAGHGVTAALMTARLFAWLGGSDLMVAAEDAGPARIVAGLNELMLTEISADTYFTMIYGEIDPNTGDVLLVQAGHPHPLLQRADGSIEPLGQGGAPIGAFEDVEFHEIQAKLGPGDRIFIASDGITEARSPSGMLLGDDGLAAVLCTNFQLRGPILLESLCWSVSEFSGGERSDDISALVIERHCNG